MTCPHIILVGFMGAGKSTTGKILSQKIGFPFIDIDKEIQKQAGKSIEEIFAQDGQNVFRQNENEILKNSLRQKRSTIIALGGGGFQSQDNRALIQKYGLSFWLDASWEAIMIRLDEQEKKKRPLFKLFPLEEQQKILFTQRLSEYATANHRISTEGSPEEISEKILLKTEHLDKEIWIKSRRQDYPCVLRADNADWIGPYLSRRIASKRVLLLSDHLVGPKHGDKLFNQLRHEGFQVAKIYVPNTEQAKSLEQVSKLYQTCLEHNLKRDSAIIALGGGMIGDLGGFLAATYMRGIPLYLIPTTTLAAVDASIGAKNALNLGHTKNVIGSYYPPQEVLIASGLLATQEGQQHLWGFVEALKTAVTLDNHCYFYYKNHIKPLQEMAPKIFMHAIARSIALKKSLVEVDEYDVGNRMILNFGHTIGHALESGQNFAIAHGKAVGLGMLAESTFSEHMGWSSGINEELEPLLRELAIETKWREQAIDLSALRHDKKYRENRIELPIIKRLGTCEMMNVEFYELEKFLNAH
ncbi:MAG: bifunctional shikimate kinase/3-dehydroquinate synthase [Myxococcota bacterium]|nr:bifunctional shikimate kinase/3-dehydroquinate synthase [Myxococcota bacterium]